MKLQYQNLSEWKEKIRVNNARNKEKFDQTKEVVQTMTRENAEIKAQVSAKVRYNLLMEKYLIPQFHCFLSNRKNIWSRSPMFCYNLLKFKTVWKTKARF